MKNSLSYKQGLKYLRNKLASAEKSVKELTKSLNQLLSRTKEEFACNTERSKDEILSRANYLLERGFVVVPKEQWEAMVKLAMPQLALEADTVPSKKGKKK